MGWFGNLLDKISIKRITGRYMDINGGTPIFSQFGQDIYASDVVQQAVSCIAQEELTLYSQYSISSEMTLKQFEV